ncbi:esterase [Lithospermum erythrorhizon]|uniref:Pectinesterase n=1 Tax=Lithospermum erythrorhizon TaxID=34254 RepID=A0AAV3RLN4_LITER
MKQILFPPFLLLLLSSCFFLFFSQSLATSLTNNEHNQEGDMDWWCETTPHPEPCKHLMIQKSHQFKNPKHKADFRRICVELALDQAMKSQGDTKNLGPHCHSKKRLLAWRDCDKLVDDTIFQLNSTLEGILASNNTSFSYVDAQSWLSAALTNIETCRSCSIEMNVSDFISPIVSRSNLTQLLSNTLALYGVLQEEYNEEKEKGNDDDEFPSWFMERDRRLLETSSIHSQANVVVAKDGSGHFKSIQAAINYAVSKRAKNQRVIVYIKRGVYSENIAITNTMTKVMLVGDGLRYTIITGSRSVSSGFTTYSSATIGVDGVGFIARGITFQNTAGPQSGQAVALRSASDLSVYYACAFEGYQDTLFVHAQRQFYKTCHIYGTIDFIFGNAAVVFQNCVIFVRKPLHGQVNVITAQGRGDPYQNTGISIHNSIITAATDLKPVYKSFATYLGRPWQQYSRTIIMKTYIDSLVNQAGWLRWLNTDFALDTLYYGEYKNFGPSGSTRNRVKWPGYHVITSANVASRFTVGNLIAGKAWLPSTGVPFIAGL